MGDPVRAPAGGRVVGRGFDRRSGNWIRVDHGGGVVTSYSHLSAIDVPEGAEIAPGQLIGRVGNTGRVRSRTGDGSHLHWRLIVNGEDRDPLRFNWSTLDSGGGEPPPPPPGSVLIGSVAITPDPVDPISSAVDAALGAVGEATTAAQVAPAAPPRVVPSPHLQQNDRLVHGDILGTAATEDAEARRQRAAGGSEQVTVERVERTPIASARGLNERYRTLYADPNVTNGQIVEAVRAAGVDPSAVPDLIAALTWRARQLNAYRANPRQQGNFFNPGPRGRRFAGVDLEAQSRRVQEQRTVHRPGTEGLRAEISAYTTEDMTYPERVGRFFGELGRAVVGEGYGNRLRREGEQIAEWTPVGGAQWVREGVNALSEGDVGPGVAQVTLGSLDAIPAVGPVGKWLRQTARHTPELQDWAREIIERRAPRLSDAEHVSARTRAAQLEEAAGRPDAAPELRVQAQAARSEVAAMDAIRASDPAPAPSVASPPPPSGSVPEGEAPKALPIGRERPDALPAAPEPVRRVGRFGPVFDDLRDDYPAALAQMRAQGSGELPGAIRHPEIGEVDLVWGNSRYGLKHIEESHPEVLADLPRIVERLPVRQRPDEVGNNRWVLEDDVHRAIVAPDFDGDPRQWVVTAYQRKDAPGGQTSRRDPQLPDGGSTGIGAVDDIGAGAGGGNRGAGLPSSVLGGRVPRAATLASPEEMAAAVRGVRPSDVRAIPDSRVASPDELPSSIAPMDAPEVGRPPRQPDRFSRSLQGYLREESRRKGIPVRIDAEDAMDKGVPAELIYRNPGVADRSKLRLRNPRLFGTRFGRMSSRQQELRSLDMDNIDPAEWGFENAAGARLSPEDVADLLRRDLEGDSSALARGSAYDEMMAYEARAASRAEFEGRFPDGPPVERLGDPEAPPLPPPSAYEDVPPQGGWAGGLNLAHVETRGDIRRLLRTFHEKFGGFAAGRRGVVTHDEAEAAARAMGVDPALLLGRLPGEALNDSQLLWANLMAIKSADELGELAERLGDSPSEEALAEWWKRALVHAAIQEEAVGANAEAARALGVLRRARKARALSGRIHAAIVEGAGGAGRVEDVARAVVDLRRRGVDASGVAVFAAQATKPQFRDKLVELWYNSLLSGPQTHVVNVVSNSLTAGLQIPEHALAAGIGWVQQGIRRLRGKGEDFDRVLLSEIGPRVVGLMQGSREGLHAFGRTLKTGEVPDFVTKVESRSQRAISGLKGEVIRTPSRLLAAEDEFFKAVGRRMELNGLAVRQARKDKLRGQALRDRVAELSQNPTDEMLQRALDRARYLTYQKPLGKFGQRLIATTQEHRWLKLFVPFVRTPTNILKFAVERSPLAPLLGEVRRDIAAGGERQALALARMALGTGFGLTVAHLAQQGIITGGGPADRGARDMLIADGWQPYSIRIGDQYYSYARLDPLATTLGVAADVVDYSSYMTEGQQQKSSALVITSILQNLSNKTWLSGVSDVLAAIDDPQRNLQSLTSRLAGSILVPTGVAQVARTVDPVQRDTRRSTLVEMPPLPGPLAGFETFFNAALGRIQSRIPGLSDNLPARQDVWGQEMRSEGGLGPDIASPIWTSTAGNDAITSELLAIGANVGRPARKLQGRELSQREYADYQRLSADYIRSDMIEVITDPEWSTSTVEERREWFEDIKRDARADARADLGLTADDDEDAVPAPPPGGVMPAPPPPGSVLIR